MAGPELWTIGYEGAAWAPFLAALQAAGVRRVIDVRQLPLSRRPGFSKARLEAGLAEAGIGYAHLRPLGTPPEGREANKRREWTRFWSIVEASLGCTEAALALEHAADLARALPSCLLCYEADPCICHRLRVGQLLAERHGFTLRHLAVGDPGQRAAHSRRPGRVGSGLLRSSRPSSEEIASASSEPSSRPAKP